MTNLHPRLAGIAIPAPEVVVIKNLDERVQAIEGSLPNYIQQVNEAAIAVAGDSAVQAEVAAASALAAAATAEQTLARVEQEAGEAADKANAAADALNEIDAPARIAELEAQLAAANSTIELFALIYPISQFTALGNPVLADGNPLLAGVQ